MKNLVYFFYFIKTTNYRQLIKFFKEIRKKNKTSYLRVLGHLIKISLKYKASFNDYFMYKFYEMDEIEINSYVTTGRLFEFYSSKNDKKYIDFFRNKKKFNDTFKKYIKREYFLFNENNERELINWLSSKSCVIAKPNFGVSGVGIKKIIISEWPDVLDIIHYLKKNKLNLFEERIQQHEHMNQLNPTSVNSIRIITVQNDEKIDIISAVLRIGIKSYVDNFSAGGIAAPINIETGVVYKPAVTKKKQFTYVKHPVTNNQIVGFHIPYWKETIKMITEVAWIVPEIKTVGWDVAITKLGPIIIEGNDNWNKDIFQIPYGEGKQYILNKYY